MEEETVITTGFEETYALGIKLAKSLKGGEVILLHGELGSGKTTFSGGVGKGLGVDKHLTSPTFIIMRSYTVPKHESIKSLYHIDAYRLEKGSDAETLGLKEIFSDKSSVVLCEWPEKIADALPGKRIEIYFEYLEDKRKITFKKID